MTIFITVETLLLLDSLFLQNLLLLFLLVLHFLLLHGLFLLSSRFFLGVHSIASTEPLELFKVSSVVTNILTNSWMVYWILFIWKFIINYPYESVKDYKIRSTYESLSMDNPSFSSSLRSLIIVRQWSWTDYPLCIFTLKSRLDTSKWATRLCSPYNSCRWVCICLVVVISSCWYCSSLDIDANM